jgi:hypothetical protein
MLVLLPLSDEVPIRCTRLVSALLIPLLKREVAKPLTAFIAIPFSIGRATFARPATSGSGMVKSS